MSDSWHSVLNEFLERTETLRRGWKRFAERQTVLAVTEDDRCRMSLRVLALQEGWRVLFARSVEDALRLGDGLDRYVLVYDRDLAGAGWRHGLRRMLDWSLGAFAILLAPSPDQRLRLEVLECGGYDVAGTPLDGGSFADLVNGAFALASAVDSSGEQTTGRKIVREVVAA